MSDTPNHVIRVVHEQLSDGSYVYNIEIRACEIPAISENDALDLAEKIADAINEHSTEYAGTLSTF